MLDLRMNVLDQYVDFFIFAECDHDFNGNFKGFNFKIENFLKFKNKIIYLKHFFKDHSKLKRDGWLVFNQTRDKLMEGLNKANNEDVIIHSDIDEIPNLVNLNKNLIKDKIYIFEQKMYYFKFNLFETSHSWRWSKMCKKKLIDSFSKLRWIKGKKYSYFRVDTYFRKNHFRNIKIIYNGGWHFTYIKSLEDIKKKLNSVIEKGHKEYTLDFLEDSIRKRINFLHRNFTKLEKVNIDNSFPDYLLKNKDKYMKFIE
jgi:beta-1,4-mannosyl-glycoprotein beta-1,4-N-acetylglucosaminyltransferase